MEYTFQIMHTPRHSAAQRRGVDQIMPGFFRLRLVRHGWQVPAQIVRSGRFWSAVLDGVAGDLAHDPFTADHVARIHEGGTVIREAEYIWLLALKAWAASADPNHPCLHPYRAIDPMLLRPIRRLSWES